MKHIVAMLTVTGSLTFAVCHSNSAKTSMVAITSINSTVCFQVEIVGNFWARAKGLMHRTRLQDGSGMLFLYSDPREVQFWMKNITVPLDMLFVSADGVIFRIVENVPPNDETPIPSRGPVTAVLEIAGGASKRAQIQVGARLNYGLNADLGVNCED